VVYTGDATDRLTRTTSSDEFGCAGIGSKVTFRAGAGTTYWIPIDVSQRGFNDVRGPITLTLYVWVSPPSCARCRTRDGSGCDLRHRVALTLSDPDEFGGITNRDGPRLPGHFDRFGIVTARRVDTYDGVGSIGCPYTVQADGESIVGRPHAQAGFVGFFVGTVRIEAQDGRRLS